MPAPAPIPVVCDRCRAEGVSNEDPFAHFGALLDFEPVPRRTARADGWDAEVQRAFIAALSLTGSARQAARAVGKAAFGAEQLRHVPGNEGFLAAWDEALAIAADERSRRLAEGLAAVAAEQAGARRLHPAPWAEAASRRPRAQVAPHAAEDENSPAAAQAFGETLLRSYMIKLRQERRARLAGRVAEADLYVRQLTWLEVAVDVGTGDGMRVFQGLRLGGYDLVSIAQTPMSRLLGRVRRAHWAEAGEPDRPEPPAEDYLEHHDGFSTEPPEVIRGGVELSYAEQQQRYEERHAREAEALLTWEEQARLQAAEWRDRIAPEPEAPHAEDPREEPEGPTP